MKNIRYWLFVFSISCVGFAGCSGVSSKEFDDMKAKQEDLTRRNLDHLLKHDRELEDKAAELQKKLDSLEERIDSLASR